MIALIGGALLFVSGCGIGWAVGSVAGVMAEKKRARAELEAVRHLRPPSTPEPSRGVQRS